MVSRNTSRVDSSKLIFLISQPRSGSSLLQQLLLQHSKITSATETWMMLPLISCYKDLEQRDSYDHKSAIINLNFFLSRHELESDYKEQIKKLAISIYNSVSGDKYFLDKTPRYFHICDELHNLFPEAKFIYLVRNPLSVFTSILSYNFNGNTRSLLKTRDRYFDLYLAPQALLKQFKKKNKNNSFFIKYEDIICNAPSEIKNILAFLGLGDEEITEYSIEGDFKTTVFIDTKSVRRHNKPVDHYLNAWKKNLHYHHQKRAARHYIQALDNHYFEAFGYNKEKILDEVQSHKTKLSIRWELSNIKQKIICLKKS